MSDEILVLIGKSAIILGACAAVIALWVGILFLVDHIKERKRERRDQQRTFEFIREQLQFLQRDVNYVQSSVNDLTAVLTSQDSEVDKP